MSFELLRGKAAATRAGASPARTLYEAWHRQRTRAGASPARTLYEAWLPPI